MIANYVKLAFRSIWKHKGYSFINILGLSIGIACCIMIMLFVYDEWQYDKFHANADQLFRLTTIEEGDDGEMRHVAHAYPAVAPVLKSAFDELDVVRYFQQSVAVKNPEDNTLFQEEKFFFADSLFFDLFSFELNKGNPKTVLEAPNALVITEAMAKRYFGDSDPIGKTLEVEGKSLVVSGVVAEIPHTSSIQFDMVAAMPSVNQIMGTWVLNSGGSWYYPPAYTFVRLPEGREIASIEGQMYHFKENYIPNWVADSDEFGFVFQPLTEMHFTPLEGDFEAAMNPIYLYVFVIIAVMILVIACINYVNLALSRLIQRLREIGMRRILGAQNRQISLQMLTESFVFLAISIVGAFGIVGLMMPTFNRLVGKELVLVQSQHAKLGLALLGVILLVGVIISMFPTFALSRFQVVGALKAGYDKTARNISGLSFKNSFVVFQFTVAVILIIVTLIIQYQLNFIQNKDLGLQPDQTIVVPIRDEKIQENYEAIKNSLSSVAGVESMSAMSNLPWQGNGFYNFPSSIMGKGKEIEANVPTLFVDEDFIETMGMEVVAGRNFLENSISDQQSAYLLNEAVANKYNLHDFEGIRISSNSAEEAKQGEIIGIVKNFHLKSLHHPIDPLILTAAPQSYYWENFVVRLESANIQQTLKIFSEKWSEVAPERPFEYFFLDEAFADLYQRETRMSSLLTYFTLLALFVACLGMFALAAFVSERRTKEIGIRKVLGATTTNIASLLSRDFLKLVLVAAVIAFPIAWWVMSRWLESFAYRVEMKWWMFALAGVGAFLIALLTVSWQAIRSALANPVDSLRSE